jgi:hypothetical protein
MEIRIRNPISQNVLDMTAAKALVNVRLLHLPKLDIHLTIHS